MRTVAIYGFSERTRHYIKDSQAAAVWTLNNAWDYDAPMERVTRWYELHMEDWDFFDQKRRDFLSSMQPFLIYMNREYKHLPCYAEYPKDAIIANIGRRYLTNSIAMMIAHAIYEQYERIEIYGVDMGAGTEYTYQKAGTEYMIGLAEGRGIDVYTPPDCHLLNAPIYGYEALASHVEIDTVVSHRDAYRAALSILMAKYLPLVERYKAGDISVGKEINLSNPDIWLYDGAQAHLDTLIVKYNKVGRIGRQVIEREREDMLKLLTGLNDHMKWLNGYLSAAENEDAANQLDQVIQRMHEHDGAIQALNKLKRHIDFIPYSLELEHSIIETIKD